jgi:hypothetical protein
VDQRAGGSDRYAAFMGQASEHATAAPLDVKIEMYDLRRFQLDDEFVRASARELEQYRNCIRSCRVVAELLGRHRHDGGLFTASVDLKLTDGEIFVSRSHPHDPRVAVRDAFHAARCELEQRFRDEARSSTP